MHSKHLVRNRLIAVLFFIVSFTSYSLANESQNTVFITGANRGIGLEYAKQYSAAGWEVIGTTRKPEEATELKATGAQMIQLDVTSDEDIDAMKKALQGKKIDLLINNAGVYIRDSDRKSLEFSFSVNTAGPFLIADALIPNLKKSNHPKIVNVSSRTAILTGAKGKSNAYAISKVGVNMVTRILHSRLSNDNFIVISLAPGRNQTDMGGKKAPLTPAQSVPLIMQLIADLTKEKSGRFWYYDGTELPW